MYRRRVVSTLHQLATREVFLSVTDAISENIIDDDVELEKMESLNKYIQNVGIIRTSYQDLMDLLNNIQELNTDWASVTYIKSLELLLNEDVYRVNIHGNLLPAYYDRILTAIIENGSSLRELSIELNLPYKERNQDLILQIPETCTNLVRLTICEASNALLWSISKNCKTLRVLKLYDVDQYVTDEGIQDLCDGVCRDSLISVEVINRRNALKPLILNLPSLKILPNYCIGPNLLDIYTDNNEFRTSLNNVTDFATTDEMMIAIVKLCPLLSVITLEFMTNTMPLRRLSDLHQLIAFSIVDGLNFAGLMPALHIFGSQILFLYLDANIRHFTLNVDLLAEYCPNVITLGIVNLYISYIGKKSFKNLQEYVLQEIENDECTEIFIHKHSHINVDKIHLVSFERRYTDIDILRIFNGNNYQLLNHITLKSVGCFTRRIIEHLTEHYPMLAEIGRLSTWGYSKAEVEELTDEFSNKNAIVRFQF